MTKKVSGSLSRRTVRYSEKRHLSAAGGMPFSFLAIGHWPDCEVTPRQDSRKHLKNVKKICSEERNGKGKFSVV
jgi:hypothetical protein